MTDVVAETAVVGLVVSNLAWPALIYVRRIITPNPQSTAGAVQEPVTAPAAPLAGLPINSVRAALGFAEMPDPDALSVVVNGDKPTTELTTITDPEARRARRLPKLRPLDETKNPKLAERARQRQRDPRTGQWPHPEAS